MILDFYAYWTEPPPVPSPRVKLWLGRFQSGWRPHRRVRGFGYEERATFYGVYIWEIFNVLDPVLKECEDADKRRPLHAIVPETQP